MVHWKMSADEARHRLARVSAILRKAGLSDKDRAALIELRAKLEMKLELMAWTVRQNALPLMACRRVSQSTSSSD
jgi:hypothetical protein